MKFKFLKKFESGKKKREVYLALLILTAGNTMGISVVLSEKSGESTQYLERPEYGEGVRQEELEAEAGGETKMIQILVPEKRYTEKETAAYLQGAEDYLDSYFEKKETDWKSICRDLEFPQEIPDSPVQISWDTDKPEILDWEGKLGEITAKSGEDVKIKCRMAFNGQEQVWEKNATVFPKFLTDTEQFQQKVQEEADKNSKNTGDVLYLPQKINGEKITYKKPGDHSGWLLCLLSTVLGLGIFPLIKEKEKQKEADRKQEMKRDYPDIVDRLVLFLRAGLNIRKSMEKLAADYLKMRKNYSIKEKYAYEEIVRTCREMDHGVYEAEAYEMLGRRCALPEYKVLSVLLVQNLKRGNQNLLELLEREAASASEERKRQARIRGEEASTKLLLPMIMQLTVVLIILIVPAFLNFF